MFSIWNNRDKCLVADKKKKGKKRDPKDKPRVYIINSNNKAFVASFRSLSSVRFININGVYIVRDVSNFYSNYCKLECGKSFCSIEIKVAYKNNKTYVKTVKLEVRKEVFILAKYIYCICEVLFKSYNELFRYLKNKCIGTTSFATSPEILPSETSSEPSSLDLIH